MTTKLLWEVLGAEIIRAGRGCKLRLRPWKPFGIAWVPDGGIDVGAREAKGAVGFEATREEREQAMTAQRTPTLASLQ